MSPSDFRVGNSSAPLMPYQRAFVQSVFATGAKRVHWLSAAPGFGKSTALMAAAQRLIQENPASKLLILVPGALQAYFAERLQSSAVRVLLVDRYRFRELKSASPDHQIWPVGTATVLSIDFAKQPDIQESLIAVRWNMLIVDEGSRLTGARADLVLKLSAKADRVLIASDIASRVKDLFAPAEISAVHWARADLIDQTGRSVIGPKPLLNESIYSLTAAELELIAQVEGIRSAVEKVGTASWLYRIMLLESRLQSSPAALESGLRALSTRPRAAQELEFDADEIEEDHGDSVTSHPEDHAVTSRIADMASSVLKELDSIQDDSKLAAFLSLVSSVRSDSGPPPRIAVVTKYSSTLFYLAAALEGADIPYLLVNGSMAPEASVRTIKQYTEQGGLLLATPAALQGLEFPGTTDLVLYELPNTNHIAMLVVGSHRFGRNAALRIHVLLPKNWEHSMVSSGLQTLQEVVT